MDKRHCSYNLFPNYFYDKLATSSVWNPFGTGTLICRHTSPYTYTIRTVIRFLQYLINQWLNSSFIVNTRSSISSKSKMCWTLFKKGIINGAYTSSCIHVFNQKSTIYYTCIFCRKISLNYGRWERAKITTLQNQCMFVQDFLFVKHLDKLVWILNVCLNCKDHWLYIFGLLNYNDFEKL